MGAEHNPRDGHETADFRKTLIEPHAAAAAPSEVARRAGKAAATPPRASDGTQRFRPVVRPPMAVLKVFDDGLQSAEQIRLRGDEFIIGRAEGHLVLPHDPLVSGRHAAIVRVRQGSGHVWQLRDLGSTNGTFCRVRQSPLDDGREFIVARRRFRIQIPSGSAGPGVSPTADFRQTCDWTAVSTMLSDAPQATLSELSPQGERQRFALVGREHWIGRDRATCAIAYPEDLTINARHARLALDDAGKWHIEDNGSLNGVWIRITQQTLNSDGIFMIGEQVFGIAFP